MYLEAENEPRGGILTSRTLCEGCYAYLQVFTARATQPQAHIDRPEIIPGHDATMKLR